LYLSILCSLRSRSFELADQASLRIWLAHLSHGASTMILRFTSLIASSSATCLFTRLETSSPFAAALVMLRSISSWRSAQQLGVSYCFSCSADYVSASIACSIAPRGVLNSPLTDRAGGNARPGFPSPFFGSLEITLERHQRFEPFALRLGTYALRHKKSRRKRPPCYK
jgi:hypothetical protein